MKSVQFVFGFVFPILLLCSWKVIAEEATDPPDVPIQVYVPVTEMLLSESKPQVLQPIAPGEIPVNEMILTEDATIDEETTEVLNDDEEELAPPFFSFMDPHQQFVSDHLRRYTLGIDNYFTGDTAANEPTGSYLRITLESLWPEGQGAEFDGSVSLKLRLPKTQKKLKLIISNDLSEQTSALDKETNSPAAPAEGEDKSFFAGVERSKGVGEWKIKPSVGLRLRSPLVFYVRVRARREVKFENWIAIFKESLY